MTSLVREALERKETLNLLRGMAGYKRSITEHERNDISQQACAKALLYEHKYDPTKSNAHVNTWLVKVMLNVRSDMERRQRIREGFSLKDVGEVRSSEMDPCQQSILNERNERVRKAVNALPRMYREAIVGIAMQDQTAIRVCDELGIPLPTLKSRYQRALKKLKIALEDEEED